VSERQHSAVASTLPDLMHPTQVARPFHTKGWVYEEKIDGWRMLAVKEAVGVRLISRNGRDHTKRFHAIAEALAALKPKTLTLDGEVAVFDAELVSRFEWLRHPESRYVGGRSLKWLKVKVPKYREDERGWEQRN
jgi:bifunctional non-homologous end joining protein LigD